MAVYYRRWRLWWRWLKFITPLTHPQSRVTPVLLHRTMKNKNRQNPSSWLLKQIIRLPVFKITIFTSDIDYHQYNSSPALSHSLNHNTLYSVVFLASSISLPAVYVSPSVPTYYILHTRPEVYFYGKHEPGIVFQTKNTAKRLEFRRNWFF